MDVELTENGVSESDGPTQEMQNDQSESQESDVEIQIRRRHLRKRLFNFKPLYILVLSTKLCKLDKSLEKILISDTYASNSNFERIFKVGCVFPMVTGPKFILGRIQSLTIEKTNSIYFPTKSRFLKE